MKCNVGRPHRQRGSRNLPYWQQRMKHNLDQRIYCLCCPGCDKAIWVPLCELRTRLDDGWRYELWSPVWQDDIEQVIDKVVWVTEALAADRRPR